MGSKDSAKLIASLVRTRPPRDPAEIDEAVIEADRGGKSGKKGT